MAYKTKCDKCRKKCGDIDPKTGQKIQFWAYTDAKTGIAHGRCKTHLNK